MTFNDESEEYALAKRAPWLSFFIGHKEQDFTPADLLIHSLKLAIMLARTRKYDEYYSGFAAYEKWIGKIRQLADRPNSEDRQHTMEIHFILWNTLLDARRAAFNYLVSADAEILTNGKKIIESYKKILNILENPPQLSLQDNVTTQAAGIKDVIRTQAVVLEQVCNAEQEVIRILETQLTHNYVIHTPMNRYNSIN